MEKKIIKFINEIASEKGIEVDKETDLFNNNVLDSMEIISLLAYLQEEFSIEFSPDDLQFENFKSIDSIMKWINREE